MFYETLEMVLEELEMYEGIANGLNMALKDLAKNVSIVVYGNVINIEGYEFIVEVENGRLYLEGAM